MYLEWNGTKVTEPIFALVVHCTLPRFGARLRLVSTFGVFDSVSKHSGRLSQVSIGAVTDGWAHFHNADGLNYFD